MIVGTVIERINSIVDNMRNANSRIQGCFRIEASRALKEIMINNDNMKMIEKRFGGNKSELTSKESTFEESKKQSEDCYENNQGLSIEHIEEEQSDSSPQFQEERIIEILEESIKDSRPLVNSDPFKNFISPNNWMITHSSNQEKESHIKSQEMYHSPLCASFQHIEEDDK